MVEFNLHVQSSLEQCSAVQQASSTVQLLVQCSPVKSSPVQTSAVQILGQSSPAPSLAGQRLNTGSKDHLQTKDYVSFLLQSLNHSWIKYIFLKWNKKSAVSFSVHSSSLQVRCLICLVRFNCRPLKQRFTNLFLLVSNRTASSKNQLLNFAAACEMDSVSLTWFLSLLVPGTTRRARATWSFSTLWPQSGRLGGSVLPDTRKVTVLRRVVYRNLSPCVFFTLW